MQANKLIFIVLIVLSSPKVFAAEPSASAAPKAGWVRFWNMLPKDAPVLELVDSSARGSKTAPIAGNALPYESSSYRDLPLKRYKLKVYKKGDRKAALGGVDLNLELNHFVTIIVHGDLEKPTVDLFDDAPNDKATGSLTIRNYFPGTTVEISAAQQNSGSIPYEGMTLLADLPLKNFPARIVAKLPDGTPVEAEVEIPFRAPNKHATLLVIPDSYGRFRPRVVVDGRTPGSPGKDQAR